MEEVMKFNGEREPVENEVEVVSQEFDILAIAEKRSAMLEKLSSYAVTRTNQNDWVDQQGKPYLTGSGAEKIARVFGIKIHSVKGVKRLSQDEQGTFYIYEYNCVAELPSKFDSIEAVGTCSSRDKFFAKKGDEWKPLSQIDECNIQKAAYTNCIGNAITRLLGLRNMTWEEIEKLSLGKINRGKSPKVEYNKGTTSGNYKISEPQARRLYAMCTAAKVSHDSMRAYLKKEFKLDSSKDINIKDYEQICALVQNNPSKINAYMLEDLPEVDISKTE